MTTEREIRANRANAKRSTGPITEEGKQPSKAVRPHDQFPFEIGVSAVMPSDSIARKFLYTTDSREAKIDIPD